MLCDATCVRQQRSLPTSYFQGFTLAYDPYMYEQHDENKPPAADRVRTAAALSLEPFTVERLHAFCISSTSTE